MQVHTCNAIQSDTHKLYFDIMIMGRLKRIVCLHQLLLPITVLFMKLWIIFFSSFFSYYNVSKSLLQHSQRSDINELNCLKCNSDNTCYLNVLVCLMTLAHWSTMTGHNENAMHLMNLIAAPGTGFSNPFCWFHWNYHLNHIISISPVF